MTITHVVIVEDAPEIAQLLTFMLRVRPEIRTTVVTDDFADCVHEIDWTTVDAIICDRWLEVYDGANLLAWLEENHPDVNRIMLTADIGVDEAEVHAHQVLVKPASQELILDTLDRTR